MHQRRSIRTSEGGLDVHHLCRKQDQYAHEGSTERSLEATILNRDFALAGEII